MSGPPASARLRKPSTNNMRPPQNGGRTQQPNRSIASSPAGSVASYTTTHSARHGTVSPTSHRGKRARDASAEEELSNEMNINVVVRCRGRSEREIKENSGVVVSMPGGTKGKEVALSLGPLALSNKTYTFDRAFGPEADQAQIYDSVVEPVLDEMLAGYNCTIFAYGQTGTGKTYTMTGDMSDNFGTYSDFAGIIPRTLYNLFKQLGAQSQDSSVKCSFIELYNEELRDLLATDISMPVKIFDDSTRKGGVIVQGMEETYIKSAEEGVHLLKEGSHKRQVAATKCNDLSSRSHTVFTITVQAKCVNDDGEDMVRTGKLNLVDLAGSENIGRSGAEHKRAREAGMINQSLLTLGRVINALVDKSQHIPYRESKLTRLLQDSLGGRTKTCIIATISPAKSNLEETMSTLDYAARAKNIRNKPQINQMLSKKTLLREYVTEIERLKADLKAARTKNGVFLTQESFDEMSEESESRRILLEENERKIELLEQQLKKKTEQYENSMKLFLKTKEDLESARHELTEVSGVLSDTRGDLSKTKKSLADETYIRRAHQKTEGELDVAGRRLIATVSEAMSDINGLHAKIGRMADLEIKNHTVWSRASMKVSDSTEGVAENINAFASQHQGLTDAISSRVDGFLSTNRDKLEDTYRFIETRFDKFKEKEEEITKETETSTEGMNSVLEEIKTLRDEIKARIGEGLKGLNDAAQRMAADVIDDLGKFGNELHASYSRLAQDFESTMEASKAHMAQQKQQIDQLRKQIEATTATATRSAEESSLKLRRILVEERQEAAKDRQRLIAQMTQLINSSAEAQASRVTNRIGEVELDLGNTAARIDESSKEYQEGMNDLSASTQAFNDSLAESQKRITSSLDDDKQNVEKHNATIQATANSIHAETIKLVDQQTKNIDEQMRALDTFVLRAREQNNKHHETFVSNLSTLTTNARESFDKWGAGVKQSQSEFESFGHDVVSDLETTTSTVKAFSMENTSQLVALRQDIESTSFPEYAPTAQTPRKRKYEYPTNLPRTEPHEVLVARANGVELLPPPSSPQKRVPLGDKEVNSPSKNSLHFAPGTGELTIADLKAGGAGIGAAFYPVKKEPVIRNDNPRTRSACGSLTDDEADVAALPPAKRLRSSKRRKVAESDRDNITMPLPDRGQGVDTLFLQTAFTTRRRK